MISTIPWSPPAVANEHPKVAHVLLLRPRYGSKFVPSGSTRQPTWLCKEKTYILSKDNHKRTEGDDGKKNKGWNEYHWSEES